MIGDAIQIKAEYFDTADAILALLPYWGRERKVILVGGESGSGKSVTALCLQQRLEQHGFAPLVLHQDDYFQLPPASNHEKRQRDIQWVGPHEVKLDLLQAHIHAFLNHAPAIVKPLVNYDANEILEETVELSPYEVLIVEGTYALMLEGAFLSVFMDLDYRQTLQQRLQRNREGFDPFIEQVLEIEHLLIRALRPKAHVLVQSDYSVRLQPSVS